MGGQDGSRFQRMVSDQIRANPRDPILISVNGYQPWLEEVLSSCIDDRWSELSDLNRELQFADTVKFPERSNKRSKMVPWSFIIDEMNLPEVYWWTFGRTPPEEEQSLADVTIIFTQPTDISENVVSELLFNTLYSDEDFDMPRKDEEGVCWIFAKLYWLLTDWQNIDREVERELEEAELNSRGRTFPVKLRTRTMHKQVDRIYEFKEYLRFHTRSFKKLLKLKPTPPKGQEDNTDPVFEEIENAIDDLDQYDYYLDTLKERFTNLIELEFNIENATQSDNARFLSVVASIFLPISFLAVTLLSVFGITTATFPTIWFLWISIPLLIISIIFTIAFPWSVARFQKRFYSIERKHLLLPRQNFTMLGAELPDTADVPRNIKVGGTVANRSQNGARRGGGAGLRSRSRNRSRSRRRGDEEKD
ncbi:hypothetical protein MBLNU459_g7092t2 [Dothideomycetes sp. NU459]